MRSGQIKVEPGTGRIVIGSARLVGLALLVLGLLPGCYGKPTYASRLSLARFNKAETRERLRERVQESPGDIGAAFVYAKLCSADDGDRARETLDRAIEQNRDAHLLALRARLEPEAIQSERVAREAIAIDPGLTDAHYILAYSLGAQGRYGAAVDVAQQAIRTSQHDPNLLRLLAMIQLDGGSPSDAVKSLEMGLLREVSADEASTAWYWHRLAQLYDRDPAWGGAGERMRARVVVPDDFDVASSWPPLILPEEPLSLPRPIDERPFLGLQFRSDEDYAIVEQVSPGSIAAFCGIEPDDIVTGINERDVATSSDVSSVIDDLSEDEVVTIHVRREGRVLPLSAFVVTEADRITSGREAIVEAEQALARNDHTESLEQFSNAIRTLGYNFQAAHGQMVAAHNAGDHAGAIRLARIWMEVSPDDSRFHEILIRSLEASGQTGDARLALGDARRRFPHIGCFEAIAGLWEMDASHTTQAKKQFERALLLGNGGSSLSTLAVRIDADIKWRKERTKRVMMAMLFGVFKASTTAAARGGSGSVGYGGGGGAYSYGAVQPLAGWSQNSMANMQ